jgi:hypothetical protein
MSDVEYTTVDLVQQCLDGEAAKAAETLNALLGPKLMDAIQAKKVDVAKSMYGSSQASDQQPTDNSSQEDDSQDATASAEEEEHENA